MRRAPATSSHRSRVPLAAGIALLALVGLLAAGTAEMATADAATVSAVSLVDDDGGVALFSAAGLSPGQVQAACVGVSASGSVDPATEVSLTAAVLSGGLSPYLQVWVERGSVPAGGSCGDFSGGVVWSGTLDRFPATGTAGIPTGWHPALSQHSVYRFTASVFDDPRAQDLRTSATFRWSFTEAAPVPPPAPPLPVPPTDVPTTTPEPTSGVGDSAATTTSAAVPADTTTPPTIDPPASPPVPTAGDRSRAVVEAPPIASGPGAVVQAALAAAGEAVQQIGRTAVAVARNGQYPLALVGVVAAFLFLQGRLDRRDPKLALARVREELSEYREFPEPLPTETT